MLIALLVAIAVFVAVSSLLMWATGAGNTAAEARLARLAPQAKARSDDAPFADRVVLPVVGGLIGMLIALLPHSLVKRVDRDLKQAGSPMSTQGFFMVVLILGFLFPAVMLVLLLPSDGGLSTLGLLALIGLIAIGCTGPFFWLRRQIRRRKTAIWRALPDAFDLITVCVEAGLSLDAALRQVSEKMKGPLSNEISRALREIGMGRSRREALEDMSERIGVKEVTTFVNAVVQSEQLGTSLGRMLRAQGTSLRTHRRQRAEEIARKAPVKMVFPLVLFIMPTFFIVTVGPIAVRVFNYLQD